MQVDVTPGFFFFWAAANGTEAQRPKQPLPSMRDRRACKTSRTDLTVSGYLIRFGRLPAALGSGKRTARSTPEATTQGAFLSRIGKGHCEGRWVADNRQAQNS
jgi:hypothetical protein